MAYQAEINGRPCGQPQETEQGAIDAYANGSAYEVVRQGFLVEVILIDVNGRLHSKAQIKASKATEPEIVEAKATAAQVRYIRELARKSPAWATVPADLSTLTKSQASRLIATLQDTAQA